MLAGVGVGNFLVTPTDSDSNFDSAALVICVTLSNQLGAQRVKSAQGTVPSSCYPAPSLEPIFGQYLGSGGSDRRPNDVCERGMVSCIRIIASHLLGPNSL